MVSTNSQCTCEVPDFRFPSDCGATIASGVITAISCADPGYGMEDINVGVYFPASTAADPTACTNPASTCTVNIVNGKFDSVTFAGTQAGGVGYTVGGGADGFEATTMDAVSNGGGVVDMIFVVLDSNDFAEDIDGVQN